MCTHRPGDEDSLLLAVHESAARLQRLVPDAVLVGGSAATEEISSVLYAHHRTSLDHDHVLADLRDRFDVVLEALEDQGDWVTNRVVYGRLVLGRLGDIEAGVRQLIRLTPLEISEYIPPVGSCTAGTEIEETLRIKAFLAVKRNALPTGSYRITQASTTAPANCALYRSA